MTHRDNFNFYALVERRFPADLDSVCLETADGLIYSWRDLPAGASPTGSPRCACRRARALRCRWRNRPSA
jgi:hypothetical protein